MTVINRMLLVNAGPASTETRCVSRLGWVVSERRGAASCRALEKRYGIA